MKGNVYQCCVYIASDGGRVCRPLVIADKGISRIKQHHMKELVVGVIYAIFSSMNSVCQNIMWCMFYSRMECALLMTFCVMD